MRTIDKIITKKNGTYGAPMGRGNKGSIEDIGNKRVYDCRVPMNYSDPSYDKGGAYWGLPVNLRVQYTKDLSYIKFYRL